MSAELNSEPDELKVEYNDKSDIIQTVHSELEGAMTREELGAAYSDFDNNQDTYGNNIDWKSIGQALLREDKFEGQGPDADYETKDIELGVVAKEVQGRSTNPHSGAQIYAEVEGDTEDEISHSQNQSRTVFNPWELAFGADKVKKTVQNGTGEDRRYLGEDSEVHVDLGEIADSEDLEFGTPHQEVLGSA
ncbi:MAG: hypothetical protein ABEJ83_04155 [Candidatus Nanohaloarchaea archaeon]